MSLQVGLALGEGRALVADGDEIVGHILLVAVSRPFGVAVTQSVCGDGWRAEFFGCFYPEEVESAHGCAFRGVMSSQTGCGFRPGGWSWGVSTVAVGYIVRATWFSSLLVSASLSLSSGSGCRGW